jgi:eukaryotic-like serine/threonine-protein kinase
MGEVYRALDTNLKRSVAIKVLPDALASDSERLGRFQREAEILASLNHPNIAALYDLERANSTTALVMELVDGPPLSVRLAGGSIPVGEALLIAKQIALALEAAHEQHIIHRDLKPANVSVSPKGLVKVLDFGLAKALESPAVIADGMASPTMTSPAATRAGIILGTAAYMSPEQAKGRTADTQCDVWAFGCVLYEMLTGRAAFAGETVSEVLG